MAKWTPDKVAGGLRRRRGRRCYKVAKMMAENRPSTLVWCMGQTQHTIGNAIVRASCIVQLALGNVGVLRRRREHLPRPRQRAGRDRRRPEPRFAARLLRPRRQAPGSTSPRSGASTTSGSRSSTRRGMMAKPGMTVSRWIDGVLEKNELIDQDTQPARARLLGPCAEPQTRGLEMLEEPGSLFHSNELVASTVVNRGDRSRLIVPFQPTRTGTEGNRRGPLHA